MNLSDQVTRTINKLSIGWGVIMAALVFLPFSPFNTNLIEKILLLAILIYIPAFILFHAEPGNDGSYPVFFKYLVLLQPLSSTAAALSYLQVSFTITLLFAAMWLVFCILVSLHGIYRYLRHGNIRIEEIALDFAGLYLTVGGIWYFASRASLPFLGFNEPFVVLTAIHFHYTAFSATSLIGIVGRYIPDKVMVQRESLYKFIVWGIIIATPAIAIGITFSQILELVSTIFLSLVLLCYAVWILVLVVQLPMDSRAKVLLSISSISLFISMPLASIYAWGVTVGNPVLTISQMVKYHGLSNSLGFILMSLLAVSVLPTERRYTYCDIPFSDFTTESKMYDTYFEDHELVDHDREVTGMVDDLTSYNGKRFEASDMDPMITRFYEETASFELKIETLWGYGFGLLSTIYQKLSRKAGQMNFPHHGEQQRRELHNKFLPISDNRGQIRTWVRSFQDTGETLYAALYYHYHHNGIPYMNIAFPMKNKQMTSVMRMKSETIVGHQYNSLVLTTFPDGITNGQEGIFFVTRFLPIRLPMNETIRVHTPEMEPDYLDDMRLDKSTDLIAEHKIWLYGYNFLTLHYQMRYSPVSSN